MKLLHLSVAIAAILILSACTLLSETPQATATEPTPLVIYVIATNAPETVTPTPTATPIVCGETVGTITEMQIDSLELGEPLTFSVYLPACYDAGHADGYPILYLLHGQGMNDSYWPSIGITDAADAMIQAGTVPFIMVFPYEAHNWDDPDTARFGDAFINELVPYIEDRYNVCPARNCQAIGGLSRGAGWAMHIGLIHLEKFGSIGAHSLGYFGGDLYLAQRQLQTHTLADFPRIYMDRGDEDYLAPSIDMFERTLKNTGIPHEFIINPGFHNTAYWTGQVQTYLEWYAAGFSPAD
jgi:enterochelin esterase-like enzyme